MSTPSVTIIIPAYNAGATIAECLSSILAADYDGGREIIVVDDGSTDETPAIVEAMGCRLLRTPHNGGPAMARNLGAAAATGEILIFLDADTRVRGDAIRQAVRALEEEGAAAVNGIYEMEPLNAGFFPTFYSYLKYHHFLKSPVQRMQAFTAQCAAIRKDLFERLGGFRPFPWGMDIENDEFGHRINQVSAITVNREFRVAHHFPELRKLIWVFTGRVFWFTLFRHHCRTEETVLMTPFFAGATVAGPVSLAAGALAAASPGNALRWAFGGLAAIGGLWFVLAYAGFWRFCLRRRGLWFAAGAVAANIAFAVIIFGSVVWAYAAAAWWAWRGHQPVQLERSLGQT